MPYRGGAACQTDIMGGQIDISFQNLGAVTNYIKGGRMKALAVTAHARHPQLPNVPTTGEAGFPDLVVTSWQAAAAPAKTPRDVVARLNDAMVKTLRSPDVRERMNADRLRRGRRHARGVRQVHEGRGRALDAGSWNKGGIKPE